MAIDAYTGLPRSGKSYSVVKNVILPSLRQKRHVYTNIPLTQIAHDEFPGQIHQLEKEWFKDSKLFESFPGGSVVVLDELWRRWPQGLRANNAIFADKEFLAEHGHNVDEQGNTTRVVLVTQDLSQIASWVRDLVDKTYRTTKLDAVGADNRFKVEIYQGAVTGQKPPKSQLISQILDNKYEEKYYRYYKSATKSETGDVGNEKRADKRATVWRSPGFIFSMCFAGFALIVGPWMAYNYVSSKLRPETKEPEQVAQPETVNPSPPGLVNPPPGQVHAVAQAPSRPAQPSLSGYWRVGGVIKAKSRNPWPEAPRLNDGMNSAHWLEDVAMLVSMFGVRYVPLSECEYYPPGVQIYCDVDGERVTAWSGQQSASSIAPNPSDVAAPVTAPFERSENGAVTGAAPRTGTRVTVVEDTSRTPRTLTGEDRTSL